jgi:hypothetical protein
MAVQKRPVLEPTLEQPDVTPLPAARAESTPVEDAKKEAPVLGTPFTFSHIPSLRLLDLEGATGGRHRASARESIRSAPAYGGSEPVVRADATGPQATLAGRLLTTGRKRLHCAATAAAWRRAAAVASAPPLRAVVASCAWRGDLALGRVRQAERSGHSEYLWEVVP